MCLHSCLNLVRVSDEVCGLVRVSVFCVCLRVLSCMNAGIQLLCLFCLFAVVTGFAASSRYCQGGRDILKKSDMSQYILQLHLNLKKKCQLFNI